MLWTESMGRIELNITKKEALSCSHPGACDSEVEELAEVPRIARQLRKINPAPLREFLFECGAWEEDELEDHHENLHRVLWLACCDIKEEIAHPTIRVFPRR